MSIRRMIPMGTVQRRCVVCGYPINAKSAELTAHEMECIEMMMSDDCLPDCMVPDGGQCCAGYTKQRQHIEVLEAALEQCKTLLDQNTAVMNAGTARIEALKAALREILDPPSTLDEPERDIDLILQMRAIARAALAPEQDK